MLRKPTSILGGLLAALLIVLAAQAQEGSLVLSLTRDWGYGGFGGDIQGTFTLQAAGPPNLAHVEFDMDGARMGEASQAPFRLQFLTDNYPQGQHTFTAVGTTADGKRLQSQAITATFVPAGSGLSVVMNIIGPLLAVIVLVLLLVAVFSVITGRRLAHLPPGAPRQYPLGGGICKRCKRPFAFSLLAMNMLGSKLVRCPYCGKWEFLARASAEQLRAAELAEIDASSPPASRPSDVDKLRRDLDESRYERP